MFVSAIPIVAVLASCLIAYKYSKKAIPLLTSDETQLSVLDTALMMRIRKDMESKLGEEVHDGSNECPFLHYTNLLQLY
jgi:hypothetical protein